MFLGALGASTNITRVLTTYEYGEKSMRGKSLVKLKRCTESLS